MKTKLLKQLRQEVVSLPTPGPMWIETIISVNDTGMVKTEWIDITDEYRRACIVSRAAELKRKRR